MNQQRIEVGPVSHPSRKLNGKGLTDGLPAQKYSHRATEEMVFIKGVKRAKRRGSKFLKFPNSLRAVDVPHNQTSIGNLQE